jgi:hypothetical protein
LGKLAARKAEHKSLEHLLRFWPRWWQLFDSRVPADAMIRDSRPKGSPDLDHVLHFAKRFDGSKKQIPRPQRARDDSKELNLNCELKRALLRESIWPEARWTSGRFTFSIRARLR